MRDALSEAKQALREQLAPQRLGVSAAQARAAGERVARCVWEELRTRPKARVALYAALRDELPLQRLLELLNASGRVALLPRIRDEHLEFAPVRSWHELRQGAYAVLQPPPGAPAYALRSTDVVLVPGVAFDRSGHRLGRGGGYYDRAFSAVQPRPLRIGVAYAFQIYACIPHGSQDRSVDAIVTECGMLWPRGRR